MTMRQQSAKSIYSESALNPRSAKQDHQKYSQKSDPSDKFPSSLQHPRRRIPNLLESRLGEIDVCSTLSRDTFSQHSILGDNI